MGRTALLRRIIAAPALPVAAFGGMAAGAALVPGAAPYASAAIAFAAVAWIGSLQRVMRDVTRRVIDLTEISDADFAPDLETGVAGLESRLRSLSHRIAEIHPVSGLPVREQLVERIADAPEGWLGLIAFSDFDRLSAFDPALADRVFAACAARLRAMVPPDRFLAQVDRGLIGLWFGAGVAQDQAASQLQAIGYALGEQVSDGDTHIIPQVAHRLARYDPAVGILPDAFVARAIAAFGTGGDGPAIVVDPAVDPGEIARDRYALEQDLRRAIDRRELRLAYQPLVDGVAGQLIGAEALIRWDHPTRGPISPVQFIPVIEAMGLSAEIGTWALNTAVREAQRWAAAGLGQLRVAVNVSSSQLEGAGFVDLVQRTLRSHGVAASQLEIELTESVATSDAAHCRTIFEALRTFGVRLAVDDFGTGYSGFSSLRALAFDKIKIDREFVTNVDTRRDSQAICQSIIALGRGLGIRVLAEGVERHAEYHWLRTHGCSLFQGYLFGRPMEPAAFLALAQDRAWLDALVAPPVLPPISMERLAV